MSRQKRKGSAFESAVVEYLRWVFEDTEGTIDRMPQHGSRDVGDVRGIRSHGKPVVIECKDYSGRDRMAQFLAEAEVERGNADALAGVVVSHRKGIGFTRMGDQLVSMTLRDFCALIGGIRDER